MKELAKTIANRIGCWTTDDLEAHYCHDGGRHRDFMGYEVTARGMKDLEELLSEKVTWRPIDDAPQDGREIVGLWADGLVAVCWRNQDPSGPVWVCGMSRVLHYCHPTQPFMWMPIHKQTGPQL